FVSNLADATGIFENHPFRAFKIEEASRGRRVTPGPEHDRHLPLAKKIERAHDVVAGGDLMIDMLDPGSLGWKQCNGVMDRVDAQQRCIADPVTDPRVADVGPEELVAGGISGAKPDVAEAGDAGIAFAVIALAAVGGPPNKLDVVSGGILESYET